MQQLHREETGESFASQFRSIPAKKQWLFWFFIMGGSCLILLAAYGAGRIDQGMYLSMAVLGSITTLKGFNDVRFFDRETRLASEQVSILEQVSSFEEFFAVTAPSVFRRHLHNLYEIGHRYSGVSQDNLIELMHAQLLAGNRVVSMSGSVLVTQGLIGTILGLMLMMGKLQAQVSEMSALGSGQFIESLFGPNGALNGLDTAFITTLIGAALGGVFLRVLSSVVDANIMRYTAYVAELTEVYVLPSMRAVALEAESAK